MEYGSDFRVGDTLIWESHSNTSHFSIGKKYTAESDAIQHKWPMSDGGTFNCQLKVKVKNDLGKVVERNCTHFRKVVE